MDPLTVAFACIVLLEPVLVVAVAPRITRRLTEANAERIFREKLLPLMPAVPAVPTLGDIEGLLHKLGANIEDRLQGLRASLPVLPTVEQQEAARLELLAGISSAVGDAVKANVATAAKAMSERGVDARATYAAREEEFLQAVASHEKGGMLVLAALEKFKDLAPSTYKLAVRMGAEAVPAFLEKHGDKLRIPGFGGSEKPKANMTLV